MIQFPTFVGFDSGTMYDFGYNLGTIFYSVSKTIDFIGVLIGGASRDRTDGLVVANDALSQLSYSPTKRMDCQTSYLFYQRSFLRTKTAFPTANHSPARPVVTVTRVAPTWTKEP
jgi:hypothetical protein